MGNVLEYKGYFTKIEYSAEDKILHGKIEAINDLVNFEAENAEEIEKEFHLAVDDYLEFCKGIGKSPDKTFSGSFNIRIRPELHKMLSIKAMKSGISLNKAVEQAISSYVNDTNDDTDKPEKLNQADEQNRQLVFVPLRSESSMIK